jgi:hypothetical protein
VYPLHLSIRDLYNAIDLFLYEGHYCLIKDFNKLNNRVKTDSHKIFVCKNCLHAYYNEKSLKEHIPNCMANSPCKTLLPNKYNNVLEFNLYKKTMRLSFVIHCDTECLTTPVYEVTTNKTSRYQKHVPSQIGMYLVSFIPDFQLELFFYFGTDTIEQYLTKLMEWKPQILERLKREAHSRLAPQNSLTLNTGLVSNGIY